MTNSSNDAKCSPSDQQSFHFDNNGTGRIAWAPSNQKLGNPSCWGQAGVRGAGCCLSVEGANPELDQCGWAEDPSRQRWSLSDRSTSQGTATTVRSEFADSGQEPNLCLSLAQDLEVYGGRLKGAPPHFALATAVLLNRSPAAANISLQFEALGLDADQLYLVRDLWKGQDLGAFRGAFTALVASHGVVHVNLAADGE